MKAFTVAKRLIKQIFADKRTIALMFIGPIFVLFLLNKVMTSSASTPNIDLVSVPKSYSILINKEAKVKNVDNEKTALKDVKNKKADAYIIFKNNVQKVKIEGSDPSVNKLVMTAINKVMIKQLEQNSKAIIKNVELKNGVNKNLMSRNIPRNINTNAKSNVKSNLNTNIKAIGGNNISKPKISYVYGSKNLSFFESIAPMFMGFFIFFFVFLIAGISFLRERISGTLDRILATPLKRSEIVMGYFFGFGLFVAIQTILIQLFIIYGLDVPTKGNFWAVLLINIVLAGGSLSFGTLLSAFARSEFQLFQFIPIIIVPQVLFCGIFDLRNAPEWITVLSKIFPMTYAADALRNVMIKGFTLGDVFYDVLILLGYAVVFIILNIIALKKYRTI